MQTAQMQSRASSTDATDPPGGPPPVSSRVSRLLGGALLVLLGVLLVEVLFEAWIQVQLAGRSIGPNGNVVLDEPSWPKNLKNALYLSLLALTVAKIVVDRRWRRFTTPADIAIVVLGAVLVAAGLAGDSSPVLIGEAVYVYLRGAIVFYAWRTADPDKRAVRWVLAVPAVIVAVNALIAIGQSIGGYQTYPALGWADLTWARINRAHALLDHPNHLGHVLALTLLGMLAWFVSRSRVHWGWWVAYTFLALAMSATQSRESAIGFVGAAVVVAFLRRGRLVTMGVALAIVAGAVGLQLAFSPENRAELQRRLAGVISALDLPSGDEQEGYCVRGNAGCDDERGIPQREVRVLFAQQGVELWLGRPILGYGVGQFGGIVAYQHDQNWMNDTRFGPDGFNMHGFNSKQVDSFWLHLLVETGTLGVLAYFAWLALLLAPLVRAAWRRRGAAPEGPAPPAVYWGVAALAFGVQIAVLASSLEDPIFPALMFTALGLGWVAARRQASPAPAASPAPTAPPAPTVPLAEHDEQRTAP